MKSYKNTDYVDFHEIIKKADKEKAVYIEDKHKRAEIENRFELLRVNSRCDHGENWIGNDNHSGKEVYVKMYRTPNDQLLWNEIQVIESMTAVKNIPKILWKGKLHNDRETFYSAIYQMLGPSLHDLFKICGQKFSMTTILGIGKNMIKILKNFHHNGFVHRAIHPKHIMIGRGSYVNEFYLCGLKECKRLKLIHFSDSSQMCGGIYFTSVRAHKRKEIGPVDDLISLLYMLIYFYKGLTWSNLINQDNFEKNVRTSKECIAIKDLCRGMPNEFEQMLNYCNGLRANDKLDYYLLLDLLDEATSKGDYLVDGIYDWSYLVVKDDLINMI